MARARERGLSLQSSAEWYTKYMLRIVVLLEDNVMRAHAIVPESPPEETPQGFEHSGGDL